MNILTTLAMTLATTLAASASINIPTDSLQGWTEEAYNGIPPNTTTIGNGALRIDVDRSASPLAYKLDKPMRITGFTAKARWSGALNIPAGKVQGEKGADDFVLKIGLVGTGEQTLNWFQRRVAADWVLALFSLAPKGSGISGVHFYSTTQQESLLGSSRQHPLNELLQESRIVHLAEPGNFEITQTFAEPIEIHGLWLSADGDDTGSTFQVEIDEFVLQLPADAGEN